MPLDRLRSVLSRRSTFAKNVARVSLGQIGASAITFLTIPIVARLYAPEDFGGVQLMLSMIGTLLVLGSLKYEMAIVLSTDRDESNATTLLCFVVVAMTTSILSVTMVVAGPRVLAFFDAEHLAPYAVLLAIGAMLAALLRVGRHHLIAQGRFSTYSTNNIVHVASTQTFSIGWGLVRPDFLGLFLSQLLGYAVSTFLAFARVPPRWTGVGVRQLLRIAAKYKKFPLVNTPGVFANAIGSELPVFMLARFFGVEVVGYYMLTNRLLNQPMLLLGQSVAQVYLRSAAQAHAESPSALFQLYRTTVKKLALIGLLPAAAVLLLAHPAVHLVLGEEWSAVASYMQLLVLHRYGQFIALPVATTFSVIDRQELGVAVMIGSTLARFGAMYWFSGTPEAMLLALSLTGAGFAALYVLLIFRILAVADRAGDELTRLHDRGQ